MADSIPGRTASSEPPCYNCGMTGHLFTACPEPTRKLPAGLERARQHPSGSDRGDSDRRHKGPIVTRYSHPTSQGPGAAPYHQPPHQQFSYGPTHSSAYPPQYPPAYTQGYPPPRPSYDGYSAPVAPGPPPGPPGFHSGPPPGSHPGHPASHPAAPPSYGPPPYGQPAAPHHGYGPPGVRPGPGPGPGPGHPGDYRGGPPHPHASVPGFPPPPPVAYGFPGQSQSPPFGHPSLPLPPPPHGHPLPPHPPPIHYTPDHRGFPGPVPPPGFPLYPPGYPQPQHEDPYSHHLNRRRENHREERYGKHERDDRRGRHNHRDRDRQGFDRGRSNHEHFNDRDHRGRSDRHGPKRRLHDRNLDQSPRGGNASHQVSASRSESVQSKERQSMTLSRQDSLHPSTQSTPGHSSTLDQPQLSRQPEDVTCNEKEAAGATNTETKVPAERSVEAMPDLKPDDQHETDAQVNEQIETQPSSQAHRAEDVNQQLEDDDVDTPYEGFRHDEATIFNEFEAANKGDPIAEPLPTEWTDDIMLPPAYNATGVKSAYITPENKDDFASGVRNTDMWSRYRHHCLFLNPREITVASLEIYKAQIAELEGRDERRNKSGQHANQRAKQQTRNHHQGQHNHKDHSRRPDNRKRRFEDYQGEPGAESLRRDQAGDVTNFSHGYEAKRPKQMSPEPGEVSDSGSVQGGIRHERPSAEENGWTGWTRGPADIPPRNYPLPDRPTATETHWYPEAANAPYQAQPPLKRHHTEGTFDGSYNSRRGRSRSPGDRRSFSNRRPHSPESNTRHHDVSSPHLGGTPNSISRRRNDSNISSAGREGRSRETQVTGISLSSSARPSQRRESSRSRSRVRRPSSRQSSPGNDSEPEPPGSPLTPLEAELLGLAGPDSSDSDTGAETARRRPQKLVKMGKRKAPVVNAAFGRRW